MASDGETRLLECSDKKREIRHISMQGYRFVEERIVEDAIKMDDIEHPLTSFL